MSHASFSLFLLQRRLRAKKGKKGRKNQSDTFEKKREDFTCHGLLQFTNYYFPHCLVYIVSDFQAAV